jgi:dTDP-3-amino-3,4,6-trideoxy-alpha-D-glucose transaminase
MRVPFLDVGAGYRELAPQLDEAFRRVMSSGRYVYGDEVDGFEREFAAFCGTHHVIGVGSGLDALTIALRAQGIGPGDEVIVPAHTYIATWTAVELSGAAIVPVDVDSDTMLIDPAAVAPAVTPRTAAIIPVHLYGHVADMEALDALASSHRLMTLCDAAQAHGAAWNGHDVGSLGDVIAFSFYPAKNLSAFGDGGALSTDDDELATRARRVGNHGSSSKYGFDEPGLNSRLDALQAAFLRVKLTALRRWNERRAAIAGAYREGLEEVPGLRLPPEPPAGVIPAWHIFCVRHPARGKLAEHLWSRGIATQIHYPIPPHRSKAFAHLGLDDAAFPVTAEVASTALSLPIGPHLEDAAVDAVIEAVRSFDRA